MCVLKNAAQTFFNVLTAYAVPGDKLGAVFFSTNANPDQTTCTATNLQTATDHAAIQTAVKNAVPTFSTAIGRALQSAKRCGFDADAGSQNTKEIILFSDGEQNEFPPRISAPPDTTDVALDGAIYDTSIRICPVTLGRQSAPGYQLQQGIAQSRCNRQNAHIRDTDEIISVGDLETFFAQSLAAALPSDKLEIVVDTVGTVAGGQTAMEKFLVPANDLKMTIALSLFAGSGNQFNLPFRLKAPDGTLIDLTGRVTFNGNSSFITLTFPLVQNALPVRQQGEWHLELDAGPLTVPATRYHLIVMADNPAIASDFTIDAADVGTGEPVSIRVKLTDNGAPVLHATIQAQLVGPSNSQGNVLSTTPTPPLPAPASDSPSTKGQAKLDALSSNPANASLFADTNLPTISLLDNGNASNGDSSPNDGVYSGLFKGTSNEGHYYFAIRVQGTSVAGKFQRAYLISRFVRSKPDAGKTVFQVLSLTPAGKDAVLVRLQAVPHDHLGNFLGPGYQNAMQINSSQGTVVNPLDDKLDGSYEITYKLPSSSNSTFTLVILGQTVVTKPLNQMTSSKWAAFLDLGGAFPHGTFSNFFNPGFNLNAGLEYMVTSHFSAEGVFGYHHFPAKSGAGLNVYQFSGNAKVYLVPPQKFRPFLNGGIGAYKFSPGSGNFGGNFGGGVLYELTPRFGLQGSYNFHDVNTTGGATKFSAIQGGVRYVF
jgi:hypothetical protein